MANSSYPADFILDNLIIQNNIIESAWRQGVRRLVFLGVAAYTQNSQTNPLKKNHY